MVFQFTGVVYITAHVNRISLAKPIRPKVSLSLELVQDDATWTHYMLNSSLVVIPFLFALLVHFAGFLQADEIIRMSIPDISIFPASFFT